MIRRLQLVFLFLFVASVAEAQPTSTRRVVHETRATYEQASRIALTVVGRWCHDEATAECDFNGPASVRATPDGGLVQADAMGPVRLFDATGRFIRELGRKGQGPGEYGFVNDAHLASSGEVIWFDNMQLRFTSVRLDGTAGPIRRVMPPRSMLHMFIADTQLVILNVPPHPRMGTMVDATYETVPSSGAPRVLARVRTPSVLTPGSDLFAPPGPFAPRVLGAVSARGDVAHSNGDRATIEVFPARGGPWRLELERPPRPVLRSEKDSAIAQALARFKLTRVSEMPPPLRASYEALPATHAPLQQVTLLSDGTLWIRPTTARGDIAARWDVFTIDGSRVGYAVLPLSAQIMDGTRDWVVVTDRDADDRPRVTRYRVAAPRTVVTPAAPATPRR
jgi:hypothetical protein